MKNIKQYKHYIIAVCLLIIIRLFLHPQNGLTETGVNVISVLIPILYLWITVSTDWVSLLALAGLIISGVMTPTEVYQQSIGHTAIITIIVCMALNACLTKTGVIQWVATWFITREIVRNKPYVFIAMFYFACLLLGLFMETMSITIIFMTLAQAVCKDIGCEKGSSFYTALMLGILWHASVSTSATPIAHALPIILIGSVETSFGISISVVQWISVGIPYAVIMYILSVFVVRFVLKPDVEKFKNYSIESMREQMKPLTIEGKVTAGIFAGVIFLWLYPEIFASVTPELARRISTYGITVPAIIAIALLCVLQIKGKKIATFPEISGNVAMGLLIFTGTVCVLGNAVSAESTGISVFLQNILSPITANLPAVVIVGFVLLGAMVLTNFFSNTVAMLLFTSIAVPLLADSGINILVFIVLIGLSASFGVLTPAASVMTPLFFGEKHLTVKTTIKANIAIIILAFVAMIVILWPVLSLIY